MSEWIFVHSSIDDLGLTTAEFRVYAHLAGRRANKSGVAYPSIKKIVEVCRMNRGTVEAVLNRLEARGLVVRTNVSGGANEYRFPSPLTDARKEEVPPQTGVPQSEVAELPGFDGHHLPEKRGCKGNPLRKSKEGNPTSRCASGEAKIADVTNPDAPKRQRDSQFDALFDALARAEGSDPAQLTPPAAKKIAVALAGIRRVMPAVTSADIAKRATKYRQHFPTAALTAHALCNHWAKCGPPPPPPPPPKRNWSLVDLKASLVETWGMNNERTRDYWARLIESAGLSEAESQPLESAALAAFNDRRIDLDHFKYNAPELIFARIGFVPNGSQQRLNEPGPN